MTTVASKLSASTQRSGGQVSSHQGPGGGGSIAAHQVRLECTFKMEPDRKFPTKKAQDTIRDVLEAELESEKYDADKCPSLCKQLADAIKSRVKLFGSPRYKIISVVTIGSSDKGTLSCVSQCVWNDKFDTYAQYAYNNNSLYAVGMVYGVYQE